MGSDNARRFALAAAARIAHVTLVSLSVQRAAVESERLEIYGSSSSD